MQPIRTFLIKTPKSPDGITYTYDLTTGGFIGVYINEKEMPIEKRETVISKLFFRLDLFLQWAQYHAINSGFEVVELDEKITFEMLWNLYDDKLRSSKKRSKAIWDKMSQSEQVKAYYYVYKYFRHKGNAEKKYLETYLRAELWNN